MSVEVNPIKESLLLASLNIALPTVDVYSDIALTSKLFCNSHPKWATALLVPFVVNYALSWRIWYFNEKQKNFTWIFALCGCYPQLVAGRIIWFFWKKPERAVREKKHLERNIMQNEVFTEAVPSALIMTFLFAVAPCLHYKWDECEHDPLLGEGGTGLPFFLVTFTTSAISAGLGLAKCLRVASE